MRIEQQGIDSALLRLRAVRDGKLPLRAANAMAQSFKADILGYVDEGHSFTDRNKHEKLIHWKPVESGALVYTRARHLAWMEQGTAAHAIAPRPKRGKKALRMKIGSGWVLRKLAHHPGTRPMPFFFADLSSRLARARLAAVQAVGPVVEGA
jgi:hypothetical protein